MNATEVGIRSQLLLIHEIGARRPNPSTEVLLNTFGGSGSFSKAVAAAILTVGGTHAPVVDIYKVLNTTRNELAERIKDGEKIPGWGNSFIKGQPDESLDMLFGHVERSKALIMAKIEWITGELHSNGKLVFPNVGCATAAAALTLGIHPALSEQLFIESRMPAWIKLIQENFELK